MNKESRMRLTLPITKTQAKRNITKSKNKSSKKRRESIRCISSKSIRDILSNRQSSWIIKRSLRSNIECILNSSKSTMRSITSSWSNSKLTNHLQLFTKLLQYMCLLQITIGVQPTLASHIASLQQEIELTLSQAQELLKSQLVSLATAQMSPQGECIPAGTSKLLMEMLLKLHPRSREAPRIQGLEELRD